MPRKTTGNAFESHGSYFARVTLAPGKRKSFKLPTCSNQVDADERAEGIAALAATLRAAGHVDRAEAIIERAAEAATAAELGTVTELVRRIAAAPARFAPVTPPTTAPTVEELARRWTSGELARSHPDHVKAKRSADDDALRFALHIAPHVGDVRVDAFTLDDAERVMRAIPPERSPATRRHVAQLLHRLLAMAVYPLRLIQASPLPRGFLPKLGAEKAKGYVFPSEDATLLASPTVPLAWRMAYGVLHREGVRFGELARLTWQDLDLERGSVALDATKTGRAGFWALAPGVAAALRAWKALRAETGPAEVVFVDADGAPLNPDADNADRYRSHLKAAGVDRALLFVRTSTRRQLRAHDARASFVSIAMANGKNEAWITQRTGHTSSAMIARYRRQAETAAELDLGDWTPLDVAIPELAGKGSGKGSNGAACGGGGAGAATVGPKSSMIPAGTEGGTRTHKPFLTADFESDSTAPTTTDHAHFPVKRGEAGDASAPVAPPAAVSGGPAAVSPTTPPHPRAAILAHLGAALGAALAAGDLDAARELNATLAALLAPTPTPTSTSTTPTTPTLAPPVDAGEVVPFARGALRLAK